MPGRLLYKLDAQTEITQYLKMIYSDIIQHDILQRHDIKDVNELTNIFLYVISNIGEEFSVVNIKNYLKTHNHSNISEATISNYLSYLEETYLIRKVHKYDVVGKNILNNQYKYYAVDIGFRNANINSVTLNTGKMLENIVYNDLICKGYDVYIGKNRYIPEIDFVAKKNSETIYFQVCEHLTDDNRQREEGNLLKINDSFKKYIVSYDKFNSVEPNSGIEYINIVD
jgi:predicted AAA+ superfamily ATPase